MLINKAYKIRIYPNKNQEILINKSFGCSRLIYNQMLNEKIEIYNQNKDNKEFLKSYKYTTEKQFKEKYEFLKEVDSISLQQTRVDLEFAFNNYFRKGKEKGFKIKESVKKRISRKQLNRNIRNTDIQNHPQFKRKKDKQSFRTVQTNNNLKIDFENRKLKVPKIGWIKFSDNRIFNEEIKNIGS